MSDSVIKIDSFVLFGALGDLSVRKLIPAWYYLERDDMLNDGLQILGVGRQVLTKPQFHKKVREALTTYVSAEYLDANIVSKLLSRFDYCCCDLQSSNNYQELSSKINEWSKPVAYYLAISPKLFEVVFDGLDSAKIITSSSRIIVEKPVGYDLESSKEINAKLLKFFEVFIPVPDLSLTQMYR